jgi:uncharacterized protein YlxP (DUF503 family)
VVSISNENGAMMMNVLAVELSLRLFDSNSLKDKRSVVKSILAKMHQRYNVSIAEVSAQDMLNQAVIGLAVVNSSRVLCQQIVDKIIQEIESNYPVEIYQINEIE